MMHYTIKNDRKLSIYFWLFLALHTLCWTLGPYWARGSLPHDTLEGITWGLQWQLGYHKHPYLTAWLSAAVFKLFHSADWSIYLLAQVVNSVTFFAVWRLARHLLPRAHALIAALILDGVLFYNINSFNLTPDTLQSPLWALATLFFYRALIQQKIYDWLLTALFLGLSVITKYQVILLLIVMLSLCLCDKQARLSFKHAGIYWAMVLFLLLISPHLWWLYQHDFIALTYAAHASAEYTHTNTALGHLFYPLLFLATQCFNTLGSALIAWPLYKEQHSVKLLTSFSQRFLIYIGLGPFLLTVLLCTYSGTYFTARWATPYFFLMGIILLGYLKPLITQPAFKRVMLSLVLFSSMLFIIRMVHLTTMARPYNDASIPNKAIASSLTQLWHERYHRPLPYIAGSNYLVALTLPYMTDAPKPYLNWQDNENPWLNAQALQEQGALFVWDEGYNYAWDKDGARYAHLIKSVKKRFPALIILPLQQYQRIGYKEPIIIGVAILPPSV